MIKGFILIGSVASLEKKSISLFWMNSFRTSLKLCNSREGVFTAISQKLGKWWGKQNVIIDREGMIFKVSWGEPWYLFKVVEFQPESKMVWECIDANQIISGLSDVEKEWVGTKIHWKLSEAGAHQTILEFKHEGLVPDFICFDFCSQSWEHFLGERLRNFVDFYPN